MATVLSVMNFGVKILMKTFLLLDTTPECMDKKSLTPEIFILQKKKEKKVVIILRV